MYPAVFHILKPEHPSRLMLLLRPFLLLPLWLWAIPYTVLMALVHTVAWVATVLLGRNPQLLWDFLEGYFRFTATLAAYALYLTDMYPPFTGDAEKRRGIGVLVEYPQRLSRWTTLLRPLLLFPHFFFSVGYFVPFFITHMMATLTILVLGRLADWQYAWLKAYFIYNARLRAYSLLLVDEYPPFNGSQPQAALERFSDEM
ncbi:MAG: DUF4389 domain-containing protein [Bacteroidia bacterium]|nr:DUF4389 domain-containing protein [Bacteroidia bacterium]